MKPFLDTEVGSVETLNDLGRVFAQMGIASWYPLPDPDGRGYTIAFERDGQVIRVNCNSQPRREGNLRAIYWALTWVLRMEAWGIGGLVQRVMSDMGLAVVEPAEQKPGLEDYLMLGLRPGASRQDIGRAYREKSQKVHPDKSNGDADLFKAITAAYERLNRGEP